MKKSILSLAAIVMLFSGCLKDEPYQEEPKPDPTPGPTPTEKVQVYINEISTGEKLFEIYNPGKSEVDITGFVFTKDNSDTWTVPASKGKIPAGGFVVYKAKQADAEDGAPFGLSGSKGFDLKLADKDGNEIDHIDNLTNVVTVEDTETFGRKTDGAKDWVLFSTGSLGESNSKGVIKGNDEPEPGPDPVACVVLNELDGNNKFIEIYNCGTADADMTGWQMFKDGEADAKWIGPEGFTLKAGEFFAFECVKKSENYATDFGAGFSAGKNVQIILVDAAGNEVDRFERGTETGGWGNIELPSQEYSFSRVPDGTGPFVYAESTKGAANGAKAGDIEQE